jgi:hypothetical protein
MRKKIRRSFAMNSLEDLCRGFCAIERLPVPALDTGREGLQAFTVGVGEPAVNLTVLHDAQLDDGASLFLVAELDAPPTDSELEYWFALLEANYWLRSENAPSFSRNPETGSAMFQWALPFKQSTVQSLHDAVTMMGQLARRWRPAVQFAPPPSRELGLSAFA